MSSRSIERLTGSRCGRALAAGLAALVWLAAWPASAAEAPAFSVVAGTGEAGYDGDGGPAIRARTRSPFGVVRGPDGAIWFADYEAHVVRRVDREGRITTVIGTGQAGYSGDGGPGTGAQLNHPHELRFDAGGDLFIADTDNHVVRRWAAASGRVETVVGDGRAGNAGDGGPARSAQLRQPISLQFAPNGDLVIADVASHVLRRVVRSTGTIETLAGTAKPGVTPDGAPLVGTPLNGPRSIDFDANGRLWLVTREGNQVLRLDLAAGTIRVVAGTGRSGFTGDGGPARLATFAGPKGIAVARGGDVFLADTENHLVRRIEAATGGLETVAGRPSAVGVRKPGVARAEDGLVLERPHGVFVETDGGLLIGDSENHRVLAIPARRTTAPP